MKQRVEVARALAVNPDMLFLDEPFGALDSITRLIMRGELLRIWEAERKTIIFVTHDIDEAVQLADRVIVMSARPAEVQRIVDIDIPHPRDISSRAVSGACATASSKRSAWRTRYDRDRTDPQVGTVFWPLLTAVLLLLRLVFARQADRDRRVPIAARACSAAWRN